MKRQVSLALAKQLKEAGYPQDNSYWSWVTFSGTERGYKIVETCKRILSSSLKPSYAAPTVAELGEKLKNYDMELPQWNKGFKKWVRVQINLLTHIIIQGDTEADARAEMWLYLKKKEKK